MPTRIVGWTIVVFWLATTAWFIHRELAPGLFATGPGYVIDLSDEAVRQPLPVRWTFHRNGKLLAPATTKTEYVEPDDTFRLNATVFKFELITLRELSIKVAKYSNTYTVNRQGQLVAAETRVTLELGGAEVDMHLTSVIEGDRARTSCSVKSPWGEFTPPLEPIPSGRAAALNPLHPINRIKGLRVGQRWQVPLLDPLAQVQRVALERLARSAFGISLPKLAETPEQFLVAEVAGPEPLEWHGEERECFVIAYRGDGLKARVWVRTADGLVLRQEATLAGEDLAMQRE